MDGKAKSQGPAGQAPVVIAQAVTSPDLARLGVRK